MHFENMASALFPNQTNSAKNVRAFVIGTHFVEGEKAESC